MKKIICFITAVFWLVSIFSFSTFAYIPQEWFTCDINDINIPEGTKYIDMLLPVETNDEAYTEFNSKNGEKYGIDEKSEIVRYCEDDYRSYTFHIKGAVSDLKPQLSYHFYLEEKEYKKCSELIKLLEPNDFEKDEWDCYSIDGHFYLEDDKKPIFEKINNVLKIKGDQETFYTTYESYYYETEETVADDGSVIVAETYDYSENIYDYAYCCETFKKAKMAYLDVDGNVLTVSNSVDIYEYTWSDIRVDLTLDGTKLTSVVESGPPYWIMAAFVYSPFVIVPIILILIVVNVCFASAKNKVIGYVVADGIICNNLLYKFIADNSGCFERGKKLGVVRSGTDNKFKTYSVKGFDKNHICVEYDNTYWYYKKI